MMMTNKNLEDLAARENQSNSKPIRARGKYSEIMAHKICEHNANGNTMKASAAAEDVQESTFHRWRREKPEFAKMVQQAIGVSEAKLVHKIASSEDWRASAWILERRFSETWSKKEQIDMNVSRSEGIEEIKMMIQQTDEILNIERKEPNESSEDVQK